MEYTRSMMMILAKLKFFLKRIAPASLYDQLHILKSKLIPLPGTEFDHAAALPHAYHFLMNNYCNVKCVFCNQWFDAAQKQEITFELFRRIMSHIPVYAAGAFYFSGGGEPLLDKDLCAIISYVNAHAPWVKVYIKTNGVLLAQCADALARLKIYQLEISIHGLEKTNDSILQRPVTKDIFAGIEALNERIAHYNSSLRKVFCAVVSRQNIDEIPVLIQKAAELKIDEFSVEFARYFSHSLDREQEKLRVQDSLFFHQHFYNDTIEKSKALAESLGITFLTHPLFGSDVLACQCSQPWNLILIDAAGDVYPCTGGEVRFREKVESGEYYFGNLLREDLRAFWNNSLYKKLRRTCSWRYKENTIPECADCHMSICLRGPDYRNSHIIKNG